MEEIWKQAQYINPDGSVETFEGYEVSNLGRVKSYKRGKEKILKTCTNSKLGHQFVGLCKNNKIYERNIHRLVLSTFNPESYFENAVVDHIDSNPRNNRLDNLRWVTVKENSSTEHARQAKAEAQKGKTLAEETRKKISEAHKGKKLSEEAKEKMRSSMLGKTHTEETRKKISEGNKGKTVSEETKEKMRGSNNPMFGKHHSEEVRKKMSDALKGSNNPKAQSCEYDGKTFGCIKDAYRYAQSHGYTMSYDAFKMMIKKEQLNNNIDYIIN